MIKCTFSECSKTFSCKSKLQDHLNSHLGLKPYKCDICGIGFFSKRYLRIHNEIHIETDYICHNCNYKFNRKSNLMRHIKKCSEIVETSTYKCEICNKSYKVKGFYLIHLEDHRRMNEVTEIKPQIQYNNLDNKCEKCNKNFSRASNLQKHIKVIHNKERLNCEFCDREFNYDRSLKNHIFKQHPDQR